jgi:TetR/AcrR family transcriptional regulator, repressor of fatR-cypB operon
MTIIAPGRPAGQKREVILAAALRLIPRTGLHNTPMSAIAREAGVATGTPYLYFESKEALINALYLDLVQTRPRPTDSDLAPAASPREALWAFWSRHARWYLENPDAANLIQQCEASGILTAETLAALDRAEAEGRLMYSQAVKDGFFRDLPIEVFAVLFFGPVTTLAELRAKGRVEVTEELLRTTFEGVCRAVMPADDDTRS